MKCLHEMPKSKQALSCNQIMLMVSQVADWSTRRIVSIENLEYVIAFKCHFVYSTGLGLGFVYKYNVVFP